VDQLDRRLGQSPRLSGGKGRHANLRSAEIRYLIKVQKELWGAWQTRLEERVRKVGLPRRRSSKVKSVVWGGELYCDPGNPWIKGSSISDSGGDARTFGSSRRETVGGGGGWKST